MVLDYLKQKNITIELKPQGISLRPREKITPEIINFVKQHKTEIIYSLQKANTKEAYTYDYDKVCKIFTVLLKQHGGYILVKSSILDNEVIAFCLPQHLKALTEQGYTCYLPSELATLLIKEPQPNGLKRIHENKKIFEGRLVLQ